MPAKKKPTEEPAAPEGQPETITATTLDVIPAETPAAPAPVNWDAPDIIASQDHWPERKEPRCLYVPLTEHELAAHGSTLAETIAAIETVESVIKEAKDKAKAETEALSRKQDRLCDIINAKAEMRDVECRWFYGIRGVLDGAVIYDNDMRALVRMDTGEVVMYERIPKADRQMPLPLEEEAPAGPSWNPNEQPESAEPDYIKEYREGVDAAARECPRHRCPYYNGSAEAQEWKRGWTDQTERMEAAAA